MHFARSYNNTQHTNLNQTMTKWKLKFVIKVSVVFEQHKGYFDFDVCMWFFSVVVVFFCILHSFCVALFEGRLNDFFFLGSIKICNLKTRAPHVTSHIDYILFSCQANSHQNIGWIFNWTVSWAELEYLTNNIHTTEFNERAHYNYWIFKYLIQCK